MPNFVVAHGSLKTGKDEFVNVGESVMLDQSFVDAIDPTSTTFVTEEKWLAMEQMKELQKQIDGMSDAEKLDALRSAVAPKLEAPKKRRTQEG